jgi:phosphoglucosamine mutase
MNENNLFGTDGIRGEANRYPMTAEIAFNVGRAIGYYFRNKKNRQILIGKDTRLSGDMLESALIAGLCASGLNVINAGIITTPAIAYLTNYFKATMGIVISASHNPYYDNGIKFFNNNGYKFASIQEREIEEILINESYKNLQIPREGIGKVRLLKESKNIYSEYIMNSIKGDILKNDYRIIFDCANGASSDIIEELFSRLSNNFKVINNSPNGININQKCGSTCMHSLQKEVMKEKADLGFAFDGDADRVLAVDEKGQVVDGDQMMVIYTGAFLPEGQLGNNIVVTTYMSNLGFDETIEEIGGKVVRTDIGDKYVFQKMIEKKSVLGGEQSGHIIFLKHSPNGDGIVTALQLLMALKKKNERVSLQAARMKKYHQRLLNYQIENKISFLNSTEFNEIKMELQNNLKDNGRILIRPSGTENKVRVLLESKDRKIIENLNEKLDNFIKNLS